MPKMRGGMPEQNTVKHAKVSIPLAIVVLLPITGKTKNMQKPASI